MRLPRTPPCPNDHRIVVNGLPRRSRSTATPPRRRRDMEEEVSTPSSRFARRSSATSCEARAPGAPTNGDHATRRQRDEPSRHGLAASRNGSTASPLGLRTLTSGALDHDARGVSRASGCRPTHERRVAGDQTSDGIVSPSAPAPRSMQSPSSSIVIVDVVEAIESDRRAGQIVGAERRPDQPEVLGALGVAGLDRLARCPAYCPANLPLLERLERGSPPRPPPGPTRARMFEGRRCQGAAHRHTDQRSLLDVEVTRTRRVATRSTARRSPARLAGPLVV